MITVEVAYALPHRQTLLAVELPVGTTALEAAQRSGIASKFEGVDLDNATFGIFGQCGCPAAGVARWRQGGNLSAAHRRSQGSAQSPGGARQGAQAAEQARLGASGPATLRWVCPGQVLLRGGRCAGVAAASAPIGRNQVSGNPYQGISLKLDRQSGFVETPSSHCA